MSTQSPIAAIRVDPTKLNAVRLGCDVRVGNATIQWADGNWRLPGGNVTRDPFVALLTATIMDWEMRR